MIFKRKKEYRENLIQSIQVIDVQEGDLVVFTSERRVPRDVFLRLRAQIQKELGDVDVKLVVLEGGLRIDKVVRRS